MSGKDSILPSPAMVVWSLAAVLLLAAGSPPLQAQDYTPLTGLRVSDGRVQFSFFSAGGCITLGNTTINGVTYTVHSSKWQRRANAGSAWTDIPGTEREGGVCAYSPTSPGEYRLVGEISIGGVRGRYSSENTFVVQGTAAKAPGAPTNLAATAGNGQVTLNWTAPADDGGAAITGYQYRQQSGSGAYGNWMNVSGGASTSSHVVSSLTNGSSYTFQVRAVNSEGGGAASASASATPTAPVTPPETGTVGVEMFSIPNLGGWSITSSGTEAETQVGYGRIAADPGSTTPSGIAIIGYSPGGTLFAEAGVPASELVREGRIFAEVNGPVNTGLAIANPNDAPATINFYFTDADGARFAEDTYVLDAGRQISKFLNEPPFNDGKEVSGTFTFTSSLPIAVIALRGFTNRDGEFLMTTLPVAPLASGSTASSDTVYFPHFADGSGWATQVILVNPTDETITGTVRFLGQGSATTAAAPAVRTLEDGRTGSSFEYSIPPNGSYRIITSNPSGGVSVGSVRAIPDDGHRAPSGLVIFSYTFDGKTLLEAGVPTLAAGSAFRVYVESSGMPEQIGSIRTGLAITNTAEVVNTVTLEVTNLDGTLAAPPAPLTLPPSGQVSRFIDELFDSLPPHFSGVLRVTSTADVAIVGLRLRYNDRGELKMTTTPPSDETGASTMADRYFPHIVDSRGWSTQFILFSGTAGQTSSGTLSYFDTAGEPWDLPTENSVSGSLPPSGGAYADLVVASASVSSDTPMPGQSFDLRATVRNAGTGGSTATTLRYYRSTDATITTGDTEVGTDAVSALAAGETSSSVLTLTAPSTAGTYYYGACVDAVSGESDTGNNCSSAVRVTVSDSQMEIESFDLDSDNSDPSGIVFANDKFYVVDWRDDKVYAYHTSWQPDSASDFDLDSDNGRAVGIAFANDRFYVVDSDDEKVYAYQASGQRDSAADFDLSSLNSSPGGITFVNDRFYVVDTIDEEAYAYSASGARLFRGDFDLDPANGDPVGITFTNDRFYVADSRDEKVYAYQASGQLDSAADFELDSANGSASGIAFANDKFYVVDSTFTAKVYAVSVTISDSQMETETESFDLAPNNSDPSGIAFANDKFYVVDWRDDKVYAYQTSWQPDSASHFNLHPDNGSADGITFANDRFYVVDSDDEKVYAYQASGQRDSAADFDLSSLNRSPGGITFVNDRFYVVDTIDEEAYAYSASGARLFRGDFDLDPANGYPDGITFANDRFYVVDTTDQKVYAYQASGQRDPAADISLYSANSSASGIAFANDRFYVVDSTFTAKVYVVESTRQLSDLTVVSPSVSDATPLTEDSIVFTATVRNRGTTASTATTLRYYRSEDRTISSSDSEVGTVAVSALAAATSSEQSISLTAPSTAGTYYYGACVDSVSGESDTGNNCSSGVRVTVRARIADLVVESPSVSDSTPTSGDSFTLTANVGNRGTIATTATTLRYYRSEDTSISSSDTEVGTSAVSALAASENSSRTINLPAPSTEGTYYYGACVDSVSGESDTGNNCSSGVRVTVRARIADLVVESPSVSDSTPTSGDSFTLTANVRNRGTIASTATTLRYYRSEDTSISSSDTEVGTSAVSALAASENSSRTINLPAPSTEGTYYYGACVDSVSGESDTGNNCSSGVRVTVRARIADLVVESPSVSDSTPTSGDSFTLTANVRNRGTIASTATTLRYYRSEDTSISSSDTEVGTSAVSALAASENSSRTINLPAPSTEGTYYYGACVDSVSGESDTGNNCSNGVRVIVSQFGTGTFDMGVRNPRPSGITFSNDRFYVVDSSQDKVYVYQASGQRDSASDFDLDSENESPTGITFTNNRFYVVDSSQGKVYVYQASGQRDSASDFDLDSDNASASGITFTNDRFYVVDAGDDRVYAYQTSGQRDSASDFDLDPDNSRSNGITFSNDRFYVVDSRQGKIYAYQASGQRDSTSDFNPEQGFTRISGIIFTNGGFYAVDFFGNQVYFVTPTPDRPDLAVASPSVSDTTPASGDSFMFTATVRNHGTLASSDTTLRYYRSEDTTISSSDIEVGTDSVSALSVAATISKTISLPAPSTEGTYYYGACVDPVSGESYTGNNCSTAVVVFGGGPFPAYDLAISSATLHAPTFNVTIGDPIYMSVTVANRGPNRSQPAKLRFDSSTDRDIRALDSGATTTFSRVRVGSVNFGSRTYRACIEEAPGEENTDNNCASRSTPIYTP